MSRHRRARISADPTSAAADLLEALGPNGAADWVAAVAAELGMRVPIDRQAVAALDVR